MKKRALAIVAATAFAISAVGAPVAADAGGVPNDNACHGQTNAFLNSLGITPADARDILGLDNAGDWNKFVKAICG